MDPVELLQCLYEAAAHANLLKICVWVPSYGGPSRAHPVGLMAPDETLMDGLAASTEYLMSFPTSGFEGLRAGERVQIDGASFKVRDVRAVGDGCERRAKLTRL